MTGRPVRARPEGDATGGRRPAASAAGEPPAAGERRAVGERRAEGEPSAAADLRPRCWWAPGTEPRDPLMVAYHDDEWGVPAHGDAALFERLALESFQAGLSWSTILHRRDAFRRAFAGFDPATVAAFTPTDVGRLLADAAIVRNRAKIEATVANARGVVAIAREAGSFDGWLWDQLDGPPRRLPPTATRADVPSTDPLALRLSRELRERGFRFVGPTIVYAFMQSVGMVDDHLPDCWRYGG